MNGYSQISSNIVQFPTPNAAAFSISSSYPESSFTGVPSIDVPLYTMSYEGLSLPLKLNYNTNLVKPKSYGSWVGIGWNLTAGGAITRVVNGKPDDLKWYDIADVRITHEYQMGYYYNAYNYLHNNAWADPNALLLKGAMADFFDYYQHLSGNYSTIKDYAPDEFSFSIADISGTFYLDDTKHWKVRSTSKIKVEIDQTNDFAQVGTPSLPGLPPWQGMPGTPPTPLPDNAYLKRITLVDTRGIKYVFGGDLNSIEFINRGGICQYAKTWNISSIILPSGRTIAFNYAQGQSVMTSQPDYYEGLWIDQFNQPHGGGTTYSYQTNYPVYLTHITTDKEKISFSRTENTNEFAKLDGIQVISTYDGNLIRFDFDYLNTPMDRLKLSHIYRKNNDSQTLATHTFYYNALNFNTSLTNTDHWGYYNTVPLNGSQKSTFIASRNADTLNCRAELLDKIVYPTGGYKKYTWEPNAYSKQVSFDRSSLINGDNPTNYAGGVRIKQITNFDIDNIRLDSKRYLYVKDYTPTSTGNISSGILYSKIDYNYISERFYYFFPTLPNLENNVGSHISYSEVVQLDQDGGYAITKFSNFDNGLNGTEYMDEQALVSATGVGPTGPTVGASDRNFISNSHERGKELSVVNFSSAGKKVSSTEYTYQRINKANEYIRSYRWINLLSPSGVGIWWASAVKTYTNAYLPLTITSSSFDPNEQLLYSKTNTYTYDPIYLNNTVITSTNSKGESTEVNYAYPPDILQSLGPTGFNANTYANMLSSNIISPLIKTTEKVGGSVQKVQNSNYYQLLSSNVFAPYNTTVNMGLMTRGL